MKSDWSIYFAAFLTILGLLILIILSAALSADYSVSLNGKILLEETAQVGDFVGGIVGSLWSLAGIILFYSALRLQREEFKLQRKELRNQIQEFTVNRITSTIYRQLEICESFVSRLKFNADPNNSPKESFLGNEIFYAVSRGMADRSERHKEKFREFANDSLTLAHVHSVLKTLEICFKLINQKKSPEEQEIGSSVLTLDDTIRDSLCSVLAGNLDAYVLESYFEKLAKIHDEQWVEEGKPGFGRFNLDQIINARKLLIQAAHPGSGVVLSQDPGRKLAVQNL